MEWALLVRPDPQGDGAFRGFLAGLLARPDGHAFATATWQATTGPTSGPASGLRTWLDMTVDKRAEESPSWRVMREGIASERRMWSVVRPVDVWHWTCVVCFERVDVITRRPAGDALARCARLEVIIDTRGPFPRLFVVAAEELGVAPEADLRLHALAAP